MSSRTRLEGIAAVAALAFVVAALLKRRVRLGWLLFMVAVGLGEKWKDDRDKNRIAGILKDRGGPAEPGA